MIQSIQIKNYQSHQDTRLEFHPGLNAILGVSDSGKSAILRALHWVRENRPMGDAHISKWAKNDKGKLIAECSVSVITQGGPVSRIRSPEFNGYKMGDLSFEAVRSDVPQEVSEAFNMGEVNVQKQLDAPFLLSKSPSEVSRFFNSVVNLEEMGQLMCAAERERLDLKKERTKAEKDSKALDVKIDGLAWIDEAKTLVELAESLDHSRDELFLKRARLQTLRDNAKTHSDTIATCKPVVDLGLLVEDAKTIALKSSSLVSKKAMLELCYSQISRSKTVIADCERVLAIEADLVQAKGLGVQRAVYVDSTVKLFRLQTQANASRDLLKALSLIAERGAQEKQALELVQTLARLAQDKQKLTLTKVKLQMYERTVNEKRAEIAQLEANLPKACPTCGQLVIHKH